MSIVLKFEIRNCTTVSNLPLTHAMYRQPVTPCIPLHFPNAYRNTSAQLTYCPQTTLTLVKSASKSVTVIDLSIPSVSLLADPIEVKRVSNN